MHWFSDEWWKWALAVLFAAAFFIDLKAGKTICFPYATVERDDHPVGFWLALAFTATLALFCLYGAIFD